MFVCIELLVMIDLIYYVFSSIKVELSLFLYHGKNIFDITRLEYLHWLLIRKGVSHKSNSVVLTNNTMVLLFFFFSYCGRTHTYTTIDLNKRRRRIVKFFFLLPQGFNYIRKYTILTFPFTLLIHYSIKFEGRKSSLRK